MICSLCGVSAAAALAILSETAAAEREFQLLVVCNLGNNCFCKPSLLQIMLCYERCMNVAATAAYILLPLLHNSDATANTAAADTNAIAAADTAATDTDATAAAADTAAANTDTTSAVAYCTAVACCCMLLLLVLLQQVLLSLQLQILMPLLLAYSAAAADALRSCRLFPQL